MNDRQELLQMILDNPDDNVARLVYADWLEEHGEAERAELIRLQCEIEEYRPFGECEVCREAKRGIYPHHPLSCQCTTKWEKLLKREDILYYLNCHKMFGGESGYGILVNHQGVPCVPVISFKDARGYYANCYRVKIKRGFIEKIECKLSDWLQHGRVIIREHPIEKVVIGDKNPLKNDEDLHNIIFHWYIEGLFDIPTLKGHFLPEEICDLMEDLDHSSAQSAMDDLSQACIQWAKLR